MINIIYWVIMFESMKLFLIALFIFAVNIPLGIWRSHVKKYSFQWFLAIHISIPVIVLLRYLCRLGFGIETYLFLVPAFALGQNFNTLKIFVVKKLRNSGKE